MTPANEMSSPADQIPQKPVLQWLPIAWFTVLAIGCYAAILKHLAIQWRDDADMGHGFFVPLVVAMIIWQRREELAETEIQPNWWGFVLVVVGALQMIVGTLGVELFTSRTAFVVTVIGSVWFLCGTTMLKKLAFPLALLFLMVPIPGVIYNQITFKLQLLATRLAFGTLDFLNVPVLREGNVLLLSNMSLQVVEACSGIRSLLTLTFLSLVYGYFFESRLWVRVALFLSTVPIAIVANASRVAVTGVLSQQKPELAQGFFHESTGFILFVISLVLLVVFHRILVFIARRREKAPKPA
jgi:exosortase